MTSNSINIESDDTVVTDIATELAQLLVAHGGSIDGALRFVCRESALSLQSALGGQDSRLMIFATDACLPTLQDFDVSIHGDQLEAEASGLPTEPQQTALTLLLHLFNQTGKLVDHRQTCPWLAWPLDSDVLRLLDVARPGAVDYLKRLRDGEREAVTLETLFWGRAIATAEFPQQRLVPLVEFANHHAQAFPYQLRDSRPEPASGVGILHAKPIWNSSECFVNYGMRDALDFLACYGFVDRSSNVLQSVPLTIEVPGVGELIVRSTPFAQNAAPLERLPPPVAECGFHLPKARLTETNDLELTYLLVPPPESAVVLRRVLDFFIQGLGRRKQRHVDVDSAVREAEYALLEHNENFYRELTTAAGQADAPDLARDAIATLASHQLTIIESYRACVGPD